MGGQPSGIAYTTTVRATVAFQSGRLLSTTEFAARYWNNWSIGMRVEHFAPVQGLALDTPDRAFDHLDRNANCVLAHDPGSLRRKHGFAPAK